MKGEYTIKSIPLELNMSGFICSASVSENDDNADIEDRYLDVHDEEVSSPADDDYICTINVANKRIYLTRPQLKAFIESLFIIHQRY
jgi:hypothetical protein